MRFGELPVKHRNGSCCELFRMQGKYVVAHPLVGFIHIDYVTGALVWNQDTIDPLIKRYVKRYLFDEGFIEHALGMLDPAIDQETALLLKALMDSGL
jgi:hypothetical protein